jgi:hypothetical protein
MLLPLIGNAKEDIVDIQFLDAAGVVYRTRHLREDINKHYGFKAGKKVVLVVTPHLKDSRYLKQENETKRIDFEAREALWVVASARNDEESGYHTSKKIAEALQARFGIFAIVVLDATGRVLKTTTKVLTASELTEALATGEK